MSDKTPQRMPLPDENKSSKDVTMRRYSWDEASVMEVMLHPHRFGESEVEVYVDGEWIGTVGSYTGSLDRHAGRLRIPGKTRVLWTAQRTYLGARTRFGCVSRAEAIRSLIPGRS